MFQEVAEFEIAHSKWLDKGGKIQGKSYSVRDSGEFETTEFEIAGFNCSFKILGAPCSDAPNGQQEQKEQLATVF